jgi:serine/threonine protein kinase
MGLGKHADTVHLINFGLSKEYRDPNTHAHIPFNMGLGLVGSATFASINSHPGLELGRRDDLESLAYVLFYLIWGFLPWQGLEVEGDDIVESKQGITMLPLFQGLLSELRMFFDHCHSLPFDGRPNYDHFCHLFDNFIEEGLRSDMVFDWNVADANSWGQVFKIMGDVSLDERTGSP